MQHHRPARTSMARAEETTKRRGANGARSAGARRRLISAVGAVLLLGALTAGCGGADAASGNGGAIKSLTSAQHETSASSTTPTTAISDCGSNRDPFDPTASPPPAGSPAIC